MLVARYDVGEENKKKKIYRSVGRPGDVKIGYYEGKKNEIVIIYCRDG